MSTPTPHYADPADPGEGRRATLIRHPAYCALPDAEAEAFVRQLYDRTAADVQTGTNSEGGAGQAIGLVVFVIWLFLQLLILAG